jgi:transcription antitermination factor NusA-like protein
MKRKYFLINISILMVLLFTSSFNFVTASDEDDDGIDDEFEELNKRSVSIEILENETEITSILKSGKNIDAIIYDIKYDENGFRLEFSYESDYDSGSIPELEFGIEFHEIVEYVDINDNGIYESDLDSLIQNVKLNDFSPVNYSLVNITNETNLHYLRITTKDNNFTTHIYISEEFTVINDSIITPNQIKINIEINNFNFLNDSSQLALYTKLNSGLDFEDDGETEDEKEGYSFDEHGVTTTINKYTGFFSWKENATIDDISQEVLISMLEVDEYDENEQKIYINYLRGDNIFHDPKVGIEDLWRLKGVPVPLTMIIILILIIGAISASVAYSVYHYTHSTIVLEDDYKKFQRKFRKKVNSHDDLTNKRYLLRMFEGEKAIENLIYLEDVNITAISEDFFEKVNKLEWDKSEKDEFIKEMLSLTPNERDSILTKMLNKNERN